MAEFDPERIVREHYRGVWRYLRMLGCDGATADDLTQETFLVFLAKPFDYLGSEPTAAYLRRIARYVHLDWLAKQGREAAIEGIEELFETRGHADNGDAYVDALGRCLETLEGRAKQAVELRYSKQLSRAEIATQLGMKETSVKTLLQRARATLRACIERRLP